MAISVADVQRVMEFRNHVVEFANYVNANVRPYEEAPMHEKQHVSAEMPALSQEYGSPALATTLDGS